MNLPYSSGSNSAFQSEKLKDLDLKPDDLHKVPIRLLRIGWQFNEESIKI